MSGEDTRGEASELPDIPVFFTSEDLPDWLRPKGEAEAPPRATQRDTRARIAWADVTIADVPIRPTPFRAVSDATWDLLSSPRQGKRARRASGGR